MLLEFIKYALLLSSASVILLLFTAGIDAYNHYKRLQVTVKMLHRRVIDLENEARRNRY